MPGHVIETVLFTLEQGVRKDDFIAAAHAMRPFIEAQPGFVHRRLSCTEDGTWIEHIEWVDMDAAKAAAASIGSAPEAAAFVGAIDGPSVRMTHSRVEVALN
ncbi:antibiotic biosynthesis monooxygenase family protein [Pontivivens ytuae]|uniref:Antibiotic biosynthesis monooxygenase n=1 Tax=Pontivivens ytuae TaxID=2789856 RepID=A0A7S9LT52_9RHOB|nr:hypothetical protein [Pontivivens ytuae]QPH54809.1 hypothetical protein I0K15_03285 [Pontivivens ytuae]